MKAQPKPRELTQAEWDSLALRFPLWKAFDEADDDFGAGEKSTEFLIAIVCDRKDVDYDQVVDDMAAASEAKAIMERSPL